eukprot:jgi/Bigna1/71253/fgenesh1_pg.15_\
MLSRCSPSLRLRMESWLLLGALLMFGLQSTTFGSFHRQETSNEQMPVQNSIKVGRESIKAARMRMAGKIPWEPKIQGEQVPFLHKVLGIVTRSSVVSDGWLGIAQRVHTFLKNSPVCRDSSEVQAAKSHLLQSMARMEMEVLRAMACPADLLSKENDSDKESDAQLRILMDRIVDAVQAAEVSFSQFRANVSRCLHGHAQEEEGGGRAEDHALDLRTKHATESAAAVSDGREREIRARLAFLSIDNWRIAFESILGLEPPPLPPLTPWHFQRCLMPLKSWLSIHCSPPLYILCKNWRKHTQDMIRRAAATPGSGGYVVLGSGWGCEAVYAASIFNISVDAYDAGYAQIYGKMDAAGSSPVTFHDADPLEADISQASVIFLPATYCRPADPMARGDVGMTFTEKQPFFVYQRVKPWDGVGESKLSWRKQQKAAASLTMSSCEDRNNNVAM